MDMILFGLLVSGGLVLGYVLGIVGFFQARAARAEIRALRREVERLAWAASRPAEARERPEPTPAQDPPVPSPHVELDERGAPRPVEDVPFRPDLPEAQEEAAAASNPWAVPPPPPERSLEETLTLRWGVWLGAAALLMAGVFLVRYAVEEGWLGPAERCLLAALLGLALIGAAEWLRRRPATRRLAALRPDHAPGALAAGGVSVLFGAAYAATVLYGLLPPLPGFAAMAAAALAGIALSLLHGPVVAALGVAAAFVTPALVETDRPSLPGLFAYLLVVTAAALAVVRYRGWAWLGWCATLAGAVWVPLGYLLGRGLEPWPPSLFIPAAAALHLLLLPREALSVAIGRQLAWVPFAVLGLVALALGPGQDNPAPAVALLALTPVAVLVGAREPALDRLPWLAALLGLLMLLAWALPPWLPTAEPVTIEGRIQAVIPGAWAPEALRSFLGAAALLALMHALAGLWQERRAARPVRWSALPAAVPVLVLLVCYARVAGFQSDLRWGAAALALAALLVGTTGAALRAGSDWRAGAHAAGAVAAIALGIAMVLTDQWLTLAVALLLPPLALIARRTGLAPLRGVALAVAAVVLVRLLLNVEVLDYRYGQAPVLNGLLAAYGMPAACFALAAWLFRREGDDRTVAVLEAGALAFLAALVVLQIRHWAGAGAIDRPDWPLAEAGLQATALALLALGAERLGRHRARPVLVEGGRLLGLLAGALGVILLLANPGFTNEPVPGPAILNPLLPALLLPGLLAGLAASRGDLPDQARLPLGIYALAAVLAWVTLEIRHAFHEGPIGFDEVAATEAELYALSGAWLALGAALVALGVRTGSRAVRMAALAVIAAATLKVFLYDMAALVGLWRVLSFLGLGLALIALGAVYQRFVLPPRVSAIAGGAQRPEA